MAGAADPRAAPDTAVTDTRLRRREQPQGQSTLCVHRVPVLAKHLLVHCVVLDNNKHQNPFKLPLSCVCWDTQLHVYEPNKNNIPMFIMTFDFTMSCPTCIQYHLSTLRTCIYETSIYMSDKTKITCWTCILLSDMHVRKHCTLRTCILFSKMHVLPRQKVKMHVGHAINPWTCILTPGHAIWSL